MYWKTTELKDDIDYSKDDLYISPINSLEDTEYKDDINMQEDGCSEVAVRHSMKYGKACGIIK